jgi:hypothetical protein
MEKATILQEIFTVESKLLEVSKKIKNAQEFDSIEAWIRHVLKHDIELAKHFVIPTETRIKKALLDLVTIDSPLTKPILNLLSTRIASYVAIIDDLRVHPMIGPKVNDILDNFQPLVNLVRKHDFHFEQTKTIEMIRQALEHNRLDFYQSFPKEPNIRIVLKTLQLDRSRADRESLQYLLDFLFDQLKNNLQHPGFITQPRHAWWALLDLLEEADADWLDDRRKDLNKILLSFLRAIEYSPKESDLASVVPEMNSPYNEEVWVTLNMMRIYRTSIHKPLPASTIKGLVARIELNFRRISETNDDSIRSNQCKLLVLYEALAYLNHVDIRELCSYKKIDLRERCIGRYFYNDDVVGNFRAIKPTIQNLIANRQNWTKHILSSLLVSGPPASGKTELIKQIIAEIGQMTESYGKEFHDQFFTVGAEISTLKDLQAILKSIQSSSKGSDAVQVVAFDEFDKAGFNFPVSFLRLLAAGTKKEEPLTFWIFGQSSHANFNILKAYAKSLEDKTLRDFLTRFELGKIDLDELKVSPQQKIFTALGYAIVDKDTQLESVSRNCISYFATNEKLLNSRELIADFEMNASLKEKKLSIRDNISFSNRIADVEDTWIKIIR